MFLGLATMSMHMCKQRTEVTRIFCILIYCFMFQKLVFASYHTQATLTRYMQIILYETREKYWNFNIRL